MKNTLSKNLRLALISGGMVVSLFVAGIASAQTSAQNPNPGNPANSTWNAGWHMGMMGGRGGYGGYGPGVFGTVTAVNGTTLTVTSRFARFFGPYASSSSTGNPQTFTVDASKATVIKDGTTSSLANIAVNDTVMIQGTINGTSITATAIRDGIPANGFRKDTPGGVNVSALLSGNGEPVVGGTVSAISSSTITITNKSNITYTIDATKASVIKGNASSTLAAIATGDNLIVQGTVNGTNITASSVIDQAAVQITSSANTGSIRGMMQSIGGFFRHMFGFF